VRDPVSPRIGTVVTEGLIEGPLPPFEDGEIRLRQWSEAVRRAGLSFDLSIDGPAFSILASGEPREIKEYADPQGEIRQAIEQLLQIFPKDLRGRIFSTLRSTEYREGFKIQSIYATTTLGVKVHEQRIPWEKEDAEPGLPPLSWRLLRPYLIAGGVILALFIASAFFIDYPGWIRGFTGKFIPLDPDRIEVDGAALSRYVTFEKAGLDGPKSCLVLKVTRTPHFPLDLAAYLAEEERLKKEGSLGDLITLQRLVVDGALRVTYLDREGKVLGCAGEDLRELLEKESIQILIPLRIYPGATRIRLAY